VRLLVDHRERLVAQRTQLINDLRWHLHDLWPELEIPARVLITGRWQERLAGRLARSEQSARVRIARDELRRIRELTRAIDTLQGELAELVAALAPQLLAERGCGVLTAAKLIGEIAGIKRFSSDAKLARLAGSAPIPASSGHTIRHRLDRGGNRQLNCALHRLAVTKGRLDPDTAAYLARKQAEGKSRREALRCLKRHLARRVWRLLQPPEQPQRTFSLTTAAPADACHHHPLQHASQPLRLDIEATSVVRGGSGPRVEPPGGDCRFVEERRSPPALSELVRSERAPGAAGCARTRSDQRSCGCPVRACSTGVGQARL
jgi:transposase